MSFLEVLDRGAGATKSGGTTRRAAKMVVLDLDHPEIVDFVHWKVREEKKVAALVAAGYSPDFNGEAYGTVSGQNSNNSVRIPDRFMEAVVNDGPWQTQLRTTGQVHETLRARPPGHSDRPDRPKAGVHPADPLRLRGAHHRRPQGVDPGTGRRAGGAPDAGRACRSPGPRVRAAGAHRAPRDRDRRRGGRRLPHEIPP